MRKCFIAFCLCFLSGLLISPAAAEYGENLLVNSTFEQVNADGMPVGWETDAWFNSEGYTIYQIVSDEKSGESCAEIRNIGENDARFVQTVEVKPDTLYCFSGWIMADGIADSGWGANLSIEGLYARTDGLFDTDGQWQYVSLYGITDVDQTSVTVYARLGGYSGESKGTAYFANLYLSEIDILPEGETAQPWYVSDDPYVYTDASDDEAGSAQPSWMYLLLIGMVYSAVCLFLVLPMTGKTEDKKMSFRMKGVLWTGIFVSLILHLFISGRIEGYQVDISCFRSWGNTMKNYGPSLFYQTTSFCDYPPAYLYVLGLDSWLIQWCSSLFGGTLPAWMPDTVILKLMPCLADLLLAMFFCRVSMQNGTGSRKAVTIALLTAFHPSLILNSAAWGQIDSVLLLLLVLVAYEAYQSRWHMVLPLYVLSVLVKPQALMLGPLGLLAILLSLKKADRAELRRYGLGLVYSAVVAVVIILPFGIHMPFGWLIAKYQETLSSYPYATVNAANLYYLFGKNWQSISLTITWDVGCALILFSGATAIGLYWTGKCQHRKYAWAEPALLVVFTGFFLICCLLRSSWTVAGYGAMAMAFAVIVPMYLRAHSIRYLPFFGALLFILLFSFGIKMHERYIFPAIGLLMLGYILVHDRRYLILLALLTIPVFVNEGIVLDNSIRLGSSMGHLNEDTAVLAGMIAFLNLAASGYGIYLGAVPAQEKKAENSRLLNFFRLKRIHGLVRSPLGFSTDPSLHWKTADTVLMLAITAVYSVIALWNLGSTKAPQTTWSSSSPEEYVVLDLGEECDQFSMLYFCQVSYHDFLVETSENGTEWTQHWAAMDQGQCFRWKYLMPSWDENGSHSFADGNTYASVEKLNGRYVRITADQIGLKLNEVIFRRTEETTADGGYTVPVSGTRIPYQIVDWRNSEEESPLYSDPSAIQDEQDSLEGEPGWYNSTYFDEIYHARTGYEHLTGTAPYETTHPPLGKVIMSWTIGIFGMTPFGWRFAGALAGILMLPAMYLLGKQLTKKTLFASLSCALMALDCMHLTQTRIATIDSFPVLFILFAYWFMLRFVQSDLVLGKWSGHLINLGLSGFFMGCAIASKWIGIYAGAGLAVLFFWILFRHLRMSELSRQILQEPTELSVNERAVLGVRAETAFPKALKLCLWCVLFFIIVPLAVYLLSYIPYFRYRNPQSIGQYLQMVWDAQEGMLSYHSTPRLGMDHPYYSPWYEWPLIRRPMYYAMAQFMPEGKSLSIFCFGNPAVWYAGLVGIICMMLLYVRRHMDLRDHSEYVFHASAHSWNTAPAFLLISALAQFLPWVLVPRGTYIYHYFATVPFLILSVVMSIFLLYRFRPQAAKWLTAGYVLVAIIFFVILYPYASGMEVPLKWLDIGKVFLNVYYSIAFS